MSCAPARYSISGLIIADAVPGLKDLILFSSKQFYKLLNTAKYDIENVKDL
jgi:hypothetical protein